MFVLFRNRSNNFIFLARITVKLIAFNEIGAFYFYIRIITARFSELREVNRNLFGKRSEIKIMHKKENRLKADGSSVCIFNYSP